MGLFARLGRHAVAAGSSFCGTCAFVGETLAEAVGMLFRPRRFRLGDMALAFQRAAFAGLPVTIGVGFLLGVILAFQTASVLQTFGVETFVANMLAIALFRELGPIVTAIILAGRTGSAFAAEIGTMKVDEELDALTTMGLPPVRFLVMPRVCAAILAMPVLTVFAELAGLLGGAIVLQAMGVPTVVFWRGVAESTTAFMIVEGLVKGAFFGLLVGLIGCQAGLRTGSSSDGVGVAATSAVVGGIVAIAVADGLLAVIGNLWGFGLSS
ncbi:MAG: MlaE family ABC transporter permease [Kiritimatiellia bacterium]